MERSLDLRLVIREVSQYVKLELDFRRESSNAKLMKENFRSREDVIVPEIYDEFSTDKVLVMEFVEGVRVTDIAAMESAGIDKQRVAQLLSEAFCQQILVDGFFHADPHPGNLLVQPGPKLVLLDFGLAKDFPPGFQIKMAKMATAIIAQDKAAMVTAFHELGFRTRDDNPDSLIVLGDAFLGQSIRSGKAYADQELFDTFNEDLPEALRANPIVEAPSHLILVVRVMGLLSGIGKQLESKVDPLSVIMPFLGQNAASEETSTQRETGS